MQGHQSPVDTDALWQGIQKQRRRRRPFLFWWWGCAGLLGLAMAGLLAYLWLSNTQNTAHSDSAASNPTSLNQHSNNSTPAATFNNKTNNNTPTAAPTNTPTPANTFGARSNTTPESTAALQPTNTITTPNTNKNNRNNGQQSNQTATTNNIAALQRTTLATPNAQTTASPSVSVQNQDNQMTAPQDATPKNTALSVPVTAPIDATPPIAPPVVLAAMSVDTILTKAIPSVQAPAPIDSTAKNTIPVDPKKPAPDSTLSIDIKPKVWRFSIGLLAQVGIWQRFEVAESPNDTGTSVPKYDYHLNERTLEAQSYRLVMSIPLAQRCYLTTGVGYARHTSVLRWQQSWVNSATPVQVPSLYTNGTEDSVEIFVRTYSQRTVRHYNSVTNWQVPVELRYDFGKKIQLSPYLGITANLRQRAKGRVLVDGGQPDNGTYLPVAYRRQLGWSGQLGLDASLALGNRARLGIGSYFAFDATNRIQANGTERFGQWGIRMGISVGL